MRIFTESLRLSAMFNNVVYIFYIQKVISHRWKAIFRSQYVIARKLF